jgi:hypothetical protein
MRIVLSLATSFHAHIFRERFVVLGLGCVARDLAAQSFVESCHDRGAALTLISCQVYLRVAVLVNSYRDNFRHVMPRAAILSASVNTGSIARFSGLSCQRDVNLPRRKFKSRHGSCHGCRSWFVISVYPPNTNTYPFFNDPPINSPVHPILAQRASAALRWQSSLDSS